LCCDLFPVRDLGLRADRGTTEVLVLQG
jgi:hypothetical protein